MSFIERLKGFLSSDQDRVIWNFDDDGLNFIINDQLSKNIQSGTADDLLLNQYLALKMLEEQGLAISIKNGFSIESQIAVNLDDDAKIILALSPIWEGRIKTDIKGTSGSSNFSVDVTCASPGAEYTYGFNIEGPMITIGGKDALLSPAQYLFFSAFNAFKQGDRNEFNNLKFILALQQAQDAGAQIDLGHFNKIRVQAPDSIKVSAELNDEGDLILTPVVANDVSPDRLNKVQGQLYHEDSTALRVGDQIVLFDEERLNSVHEVLRNRKIKKENVADFLKNPTSYIDANYVDLDVGFSYRVQGVTEFKHAYFGETDQTGIDWFGKKFSDGDLYTPGKLSELIKDPEELINFREEVNKARETGATQVDFKGKTIDISNDQQLDEIMQKIAKSFEQPEGCDETDDSRQSDGMGENDNFDDDQDDPEDTSKVAVVDILLNDDELNTPSDFLQKVIEDVLYPDDQLSWDNYIRTPYPHQKMGVSWILGLYLKEQKSGGLLADDMGLGKTFMSLAAIEQYCRSTRHENPEFTQKPVLIVAPLSLLENWKNEVADTFKTSPFKDIVILQSDGDLNRFRVGQPETKISEEELQSGKPRYSLKISDKYKEDRLDVPGRLVITTYQTLRDYQFSLCAVEWLFAVYDEAQNIKNPNTLQTRAAKGINAEFNLLATGTPVENSLADFWCLMDTVNPGYLGDYQSFRDTYVNPILRAANDEVENVRATIGRALREKVGALMLRRIKEDNLEGLPDKHIFAGTQDDNFKYLDELASQMKNTQLSAYNEVLHIGASSDTNVALATLQRLRDVSLHPQLLMGGDFSAPASINDIEDTLMRSGKFQSLIKVIDDIKDRGEKCIIFVINKKLQTYLAKALSRYYKLPPLFVINGDAKAVAKRANTHTRMSMIREFEAREGFNLILMSPVAAGVGLTVVGANNVIHLERHWNPAKEAQATDRVYRIGQKKDVNVYIPLVHHPEFQSFDVNLHHLLSNKTLLKDAVVTPEQVMPAPEGMHSSTIEVSTRITSELINQLSWQEFEALSAELLARKYQADQAWLTKDGADYGADAVLLKGKEIILIQCKFTQRISYEGYNAVREVAASKTEYEAAFEKSVSELIFITNAVKVSKKARDLAKNHNVDILTGNQVLPLLKDFEVTYSDIIKRLESKRYSI